MAMFQLDSKSQLVCTAHPTRLTQKDPLNRVTTSTYDSAGRQDLRLDPRGYRTTYSYDANDNLISREYPDGSRVTFVFDSVGQPTTMEDVTGVTTSRGVHLQKMKQLQKPPNRQVFNLQMR